MQKWGYSKKKKQAYPKARKKYGLVKLIGSVVPTTGKISKHSFFAKQIDLHGRTAKKPEKEEKFDNYQDPTKQKDLHGLTVDEVLKKGGQPVICDYCDKPLLNDELPDSIGEYKQVHPDCLYSIEDGDRAEPDATVVYGNSDERHTIGSYHNDTDGDFTVHWTGSGYRGYYDVIPSKDWVNIVNDNILSYSKDAEDLEEFDELVRRILDEKGIEYARAFARSSNLFSTSYDMFVKKKDHQKYLKVKKQIESLQKILRNPQQHFRTAMTGSSEETLDNKLHADELMLAMRLLEKGFSPAEAVANVKGYEEHLKRKGIAPREPKP